jgi:hypothetical protein
MLSPVMLSCQLTLGPSGQRVPVTSDCKVLDTFKTHIIICRQYYIAANTGFEKCFDWAKTGSAI